jgi:hypothetical protein
MKRLGWFIVAVMVVACSQDGPEGESFDNGFVSSDMARFLADVTGLTDHAILDRAWQQTVCKASCENRVCGTDGCGGSCGLCDDRDNVECMANTCTAAGQCEIRFHREGIGCNDTDPCTIGDTCNKGECVGMDLDTCGGQLDTCVVAGSAGDVVHCPVQLAGRTSESARAANFAFRLHYDATRTKLIRLTCPAEMPNSSVVVDPCAVSQGTTLPPAILGGPGHTILTNPSHPDDWDGNVKTVLFNVGTPANITNAHLTKQDSIVGSPMIYEMVFEILEDISVEDALKIELVELDVSDINGNTLDASLYKGVIITD